MAKDRLFFLISVACLGILAAFLFSKKSPNNSTNRNKDQAQQQVKEMVQIMVSLQEIDVGDKLLENTFSWEEIEPKDVEATHIVKNPKTDKWINEAVAVKQIPKGERIMRLDIMWPQENDRRGLIKSLPVEHGKKAILFQFPTVSAITQFLKPGAFVDIIFSSESEIGFGSVNLTLLKNIRVLAIGQKDGMVQKAVSKEGPAVLLEMNAREAEIFSYANGAGILSLGFADDKGNRSHERDDLADLLLQSQSDGNFNSILITYMMRNLFPGTDVKVTATPKGYIASGKVKDPQVAEKISEILSKLADGGDKDFVDLMEVDPQQVLIAVRVCEVDRDVKYNLGINWEALYEHGTESLTLAAIFPRPGKTDPNYVIDADGFQTGNWTLSAIIDLLQEKGKGRVLAEPNLTTISGEPAHFFAGGEFPILIPQGGTLAGTVTVEYKQFGVILDFTPYVDLNGLITLHIVPEVSTIDKQNSVKLQGFDIPSLISRRADTTVRLWPGQSYAIAGLLQSARLCRIHSLFGLNQLPIIGPLFNSKKLTKKQTELMIIITPFLVSSEKEDFCNAPQEYCPPDYCEHCVY